MISGYKTILLMLFDRQRLYDHPTLKRNLSLEIVPLSNIDHVQATPLLSLQNGKKVNAV